MCTTVCSVDGVPTVHNGEQEERGGSQPYQEMGEGGMMREELLSSATLSEG